MSAAIEDLGDGWVQVGYACVRASYVYSIYLGFQPYRFTGRRAADGKDEIDHTSRWVLEMRVKSDGHAYHCWWYEEKAAALADMRQAAEIVRSVAGQMPGRAR